MMNKIELSKYFKSVLEQDRAPIVICNLEHQIIYLNAAAKIRYANSGGEKLLGQSLLNCHNERSQELIYKVINWFKESKDNNIIYTFHNEKENKDVYMVALRDESDELIGYYEKHESRNIESTEAYNFKKH